MSDANQTLGMGWLPDYPSLRDHTVNHDVVSARLKELGQTQSIKSLLASVNPVAVPAKLPTTADLRDWCPLRLPSRAISALTS